MLLRYLRHACRNCADPRYVRLATLSVSHLYKLRIEQTKSRSRHSNDNALADSKNASVGRKHKGYAHISQQYAQPFYQETFNPWLNLHPPCLFATEITSSKCKIIKRYKHTDVKTPLECLAQFAHHKTRQIKHLQHGC